MKVRGIGMDRRATHPQSSTSATKTNLLRTDERDLSVVRRELAELQWPTILRSRNRLLRLQGLHVRVLRTISVGGLVPVRVHGRVAELLVEVRVPVVAALLHVHVERVDGGVGRVHDLEDHAGLVVGLHQRAPLRLAAVERLAVLQELGQVSPALVHAYVLLAGVVASASVLGRHPVLVGVGIAEGFLGGEDPGALVALGVHVEVVGHAVVRVDDGEGRVRPTVIADDRGDPDVLRLTVHTPLRRDLEVGHVESVAIVLDHLLVVRSFVVAFVLVVLVSVVADRLVVAGVARAVLLALAVVPTAHVHHGARKRLGLHHIVVAVVVEREVQVRARVVRTGRASGVARVADLADGVALVHPVAHGSGDLREVAVPRHVAVRRLDQHAVAVAVTLVLGPHDRAGENGGDVLAVRLAAALAEVECQRVVPVAEPVVHVGPGVVALGDHPVLARPEGQRKLRTVAAGTVLRRRLIGTPHLALGVQHRLLTAGEKGQKARGKQHYSPPCCGCCRDSIQAKSAENKSSRSFNSKNEKASPP